MSNMNAETAARLKKEHSKDTTVLSAYAESMNDHMRGILSDASFGRGDIKLGYNTNAAKGIVKGLADIIFKGETISAGESGSTYGTDKALQANVRKPFVDKMKQEYIARGENALLESQTGGGVYSDISTMKQLYMVALAQGVVQSTYNKIFKTVVDANPVYQREIFFPRLIDKNKKKYPLADVVNDNEKILEITSGASANLEFDLAFTSQSIETNILDAYNAASGLAAKINGPFNFVNNGFKIASIEYDDNGTTKTIDVDATSMANHSQSGEISDTVGIINLTLSAINPTDQPIRLYGSINANGDAAFTTNDTNVKAIKVRFVLPPVGMQNPFTVQTVKAKYQEQITRYVQATCTLGPDFLDNNLFYVGKDAIEEFNTQVITTTNASKDAWSFKVAEDLIEELRNDPTNTEKYINDQNYFNAPTRKILAEETLDMNFANYGYTDDISGQNQKLGQILFDLLNEIEVHMNPTERNFNMYSPSVGAQWLKDAYGNNISKFNIIGNTGSEIAGLSTPYDIMRTTVGDLYNVNYICSNRLRAQSETVNGGATGYGHYVPAGKDAEIRTTDYTIIPMFEESKDSFVFVSGKEYMTEGTGTTEDTFSPSMNYRHRYELLKMHKVMGRLRFTQAPLSAK